MDRRDFMKWQAKGFAALSLGAAGVWTPESLFAATPDIVKVKGSPAAATRAAVEMLGGIGKFVKPGQRVIIKPNMSFQRTPAQASNTHPDVVKELVIMCKEAKAGKILILDHTLSPPDRCLEISGIKPAIDAIDSDIVFSANRHNLYNDVSLPQGKKLSKTQILKEVLKADVLIAAPVAKSHSGAGVSLSMKGMMGLVWDRWAFHVGSLDTCIVDMCTELKADLAVIDGSRVLSTGGPRGPGKVLKENTIIASKDMVAADACAVASFTWYGRKIKPSQVGHIREAHRRGLGRADIENMNIQTLSI